MLTRFKICHSKPKYPLFLSVIHTSTSSILPEPYSFKEAEKYIEWRQAMSQEYDALIANET